MRVLLIDPPYERLIGFRSEWFPLGLAHIASYLGQNGHQVRIYHAEHAPDTEYKSVIRYSDSFRHYKLSIDSDTHPAWKEAEDVVKLFNPVVVGISVLTPKIPSAYKLARIFKRLNPDIRVVFGNHHPTIRPDEVLSNEDVDFVVRGEGEETFRDLLDKLDQPTLHNTIPGLSFRQNGKIIHNPDRELMVFFDRLPLPAREKLWNISTYTTGQLGMVMTSRGCPYNCAFCASKNLWRKRVRFRPIENVLEEIKELRSRYSVHNITFMDDSFTVNGERVKEFCAALLDSGLDITWSCLTRANMVTDDGVALMKRAGCTKMDIGIESGNQRILNLVDKGITLEQIKVAVRILRRNDIFWSGFFMFGFPTETENEILDTMNFIRELRPGWVNIGIFTPYPGTELYDLSAQKGLITDPPDYTLYSHQNYEDRSTDTISKEAFKSLARRIFHEVHRYNRSYRGLLRRALSMKYHRNHNLLLQDAKKVFTWLK